MTDDRLLLRTSHGLAPAAITRNAFDCRRPFGRSVGRVFYTTNNNQRYIITVRVTVCVRWLSFEHNLKKTNLSAAGNVRATECGRRSFAHEKKKNSIHTKYIKEKNQCNYVPKTTACDRTEWPNDGRVNIFSLKTIPRSVDDDGDGDA